MLCQGSLESRCAYDGVRLARLYGIPGQGDDGQDSRTDVARPAFGQTDTRCGKAVAHGVVAIGGVLGYEGVFAPAAQNVIIPAAGVCPEERKMVYRGRVKNGVVVLEQSARLAEGAEVSVRPLRRAARASGRKKAPSTLYERLKSVAGKAKGLPPDASINHDHYLYGLPKR